MHLLRRWLVLGLVSVAAWTAGCATPGLVEGRDDVRIGASSPTPDGEKIEVSEFVWFGCPHCADMHPRVQAWKRSQPADVRVRMRPVVFRDSWAHGARLHYTLESLDALEAQADAVFEAVQVDGLDLADERAVIEWAARRGLDRERFLAAHRSPGIETRVAEAVSGARDAQLTGVPSFVVDGRYLTSNRLSGSAPETLSIVERLIAKVRAERSVRRP